MPPPEVRGCTHFVGEIMPLINAGDAAKRARDVIEQAFDYWKIDAKARQPAGSGAPDVMKYPGINGLPAIYRGN